MAFINSIPDLKDLPPNPTLEDVSKNYSDLITLLNFVLKSLTFQSNFNGYIANVTFPAVSDPSLGVVRIQHFLGVTPKWRVILRQEGNGVLSDIPSGWNEKYITVKNNGAVVVRASIWIVRE